MLFILFCTFVIYNCCGCLFALDWFVVYYCWLVGGVFSFVCLYLCLF